MTQSDAMRFRLHVFTGGLLSLTSILAPCFHRHPHWAWFHMVGASLGLLIVAGGFLASRRRLASISMGLCVSVLSFYIALGACEGIFRLSGYDFAVKSRKKIAPYYRQPTVPTGEVYFRHHGPETWTGQVLNSELKRRGITPNPYAEEQVITVEYNKQGFRNPPQMKDWPIAVAGDSFTELGYLPYEQLFTTVMGKSLNVPVLNLGVCQTGPLSYLSFLEDYGIAPGTKHVVIAFFEGNDLGDLDQEYQALTQWQQTRVRPYRKMKRQSSFLKALGAVMEPGEKKFEGELIWAFYRGPGGETRMTLDYTPPGRDRLSKSTIEHLHFFFDKYTDFGRRHGVTTWLAYLPCKLRVHYGRLRLPDGTPQHVRDWKPNDLPQVIEGLCRQHGVRFIDTTPALIEAGKTSLCFNSVYDTHLDSAGSVIVGRELARQMAAALAAPAVNPATSPATSH